MGSAGFGEHLRREREMRGVSLEEIAGATRISTRFLEALEKEAWHQLPGGVFNRGFVRTVARFLGLEEESLLAEYSLAKGEPSAPPPVPTDLPVQPVAAKQRPAGVRQQPAAAKQSAQSMRKISWLAVAALPAAAVLAASGWFAWQTFQSSRAEWDAAARALPAPPAPPRPPSGFWSALEDSTVSAPEGPLASPSPWPAQAANFHLKIYADKDTSLTISSDGSPVFAGSMSAGEIRSVSAASTLTVETHDAGAIRLELNGQPVQAIGRPGQPGRITLGNPGSPADAGGHN